MGYRKGKRKAASPPRNRRPASRAKGITRMERDVRAVVRGVTKPLRRLLK